ncbi:four-helix bundle copper-binding protein [Clostridium sp. JS66]|uniref:four-helix bundle copper-binding protein n=1 Tax=Clostridium sp. JS66 TaxID=3064705 RepID=UPI00298E7F2E|nr:four-helix bundle copper-binding protein [Clostridium sp. JS66]WPC39463.1 four-helix bundle copper-binding protein [Clostridium sp. JS66]
MNATLMAPSTQYQACIDACNKCAQLCQECFRMCLLEADVKAREHCIMDLVDCAEICSTAACAMSRRSFHVNELCSSCATICDECASECNKFPQEHCKMCADACRQCANECRKMDNMV